MHSNLWTYKNHGDVALRLMSSFWGEKVFASLWGKNTEQEMEPES